MKRTKTTPADHSSLHPPAVPPVGQQSNAAATLADGPLAKLRGSVRRYDSPTDPVWPGVEGGNCTKR
jgi:hypothetical protein